MTVKVYIVESERGWGQRVDETLTFDTRQQAEQYVAQYNAKHNPPRDVTPDWYMTAVIE